MVSLEIISIVIFLALIGIFIYRDRKNIEFKYVLLIKRSQSGKKWIHSFADRHRNKLRFIGNISIIVAVIASILGMWLLLSSTYRLIFRPELVTEPPVRLIFPSISGIQLPSFILGVPFWYWVIGVFLVMFAHEPMHALLTRAEKIKIKSFGVLLLLILPGAFVEPDDRQLKKSKPLKKLRIYAAGSFGNIILAGIILMIILGFNSILSKLLIPQGIVFDKTIPNTGADEVGLNGMIMEINSKDVKSFDDFIRVLESVEPGDIILIKTTTGTFNVKTISNPDNPSLPFIGIENPDVSYIYGGILTGLGVVGDRTRSVISWVSGLLGWSLILNLGVGIFNLFPLKPLDGGLIFEEIVKYFYKGKGAETIINSVSLFVFALVIFNLFGPRLLGLG